MTNLKDNHIWKIILIFVIIFQKRNVLNREDKTHHTLKLKFIEIIPEMMK